MKLRRILLLLPALLLISCGSSVEEEDSFTFTADDAEKISEILDRIENGQGTVESTEGLVEGALPLDSGVVVVEEEVVVDVADAHRFDALRSKLGSLEENTFRVTNAFVNVRESPSIQAPLVEELTQGALLKALSFPSAQWGEVQLEDGRHGYVSTAYIARVVSDEQLEAIKKQYEGQYEVNFAFLNVRAEPKAGALKLGELGAHELVKPLAIEGEWARIPYAGKEGYISSQYLKPYLPKLIVRQERFTIPLLRYRGDEAGIADTLVRHLAFLKAEGKNVITLRAFYDLLLTQQQRDTKIPGNYVILLIADATKETIKDIADALRASDATATIFVASDQIGADGISPDLIRLLSSNGNDVESAGKTGNDLRALTNQEVLTELAKSRQVLAELTGKEIIAVAYPRGGTNDRMIEHSLPTPYPFFFIP